MSKHNSQRGNPNPEEVKSPEKAGKAEGEEILSSAEKEATPSGSPETNGSGSRGAEEAGSPQDLTERVADLEAQLAEANNQFLRKAADFENFRKRMNREKQEAIDFANQSLLLDLIPILDDFERAIKAAVDTEGKVPSSGEFAGFYEGITMIEKRLRSQLENKWGLKRFDSAGEVFDPNRHEAIMMEKSPEITEAVVQEDFLKGYTLKDRIVRSAKVKVLMPENPPAGADPESAEGVGAEKEGQVNL
ncbi:MAG: nucleotide exchange factor GrpE [Treponema sp.]|jgi:molecular chaperone GrpE|nr:nucleotide exchange factor GrpE [Treponema sp.]